MKGRSHRLPISDPPDDWVEESWTVDCLCGVNFDDGEEMVNCDECGVWVHTRCSRYVKGESSFHCDKCKSKNRRNDSEETEVAQLLVELPTKTMRLESSCHLNNPPTRRPFVLWTERPIEERVHVQGIPGGEPALFRGSKTVFTRELWNCTGYVPKKFNFQYKEFPCWEQKQESDDRTEDESENPVNRGAGVLFSLSKETMLATPMATKVSLRDQAVKGGSGRKPSLIETNNCNSKERDDIRHVQSDATKEKHLLRPIAVHSRKLKKEDQGTSKDRSGKKKARIAEKDPDAKKRDSKTIRTVFPPINHAKQMESYKERGPEFFKSAIKSTKSGISKDTVAREPVPDCTYTVDNNVEKNQDRLAATEDSPEVFSTDMSRHNFSVGGGVNAGDQIAATTDSFLKSGACVPLPLEDNDVGKTLASEEGVSITVDRMGDNGVHSCRDVELPLKELRTAIPDIKDAHLFQSLTGNMSMSPARPVVELKMEEDFENPGVFSNVRYSPSTDVRLDEAKQMAQHPGISGDHLSEENKVVDAALSSLHSCEHKAQDVDRCSDAVSACYNDKSDDLYGDPCQFKRECESLKSSLAVQKSFLVAKHDPKLAEETSKLGVTTSSQSVLPSQQNIISNVGKFSSPSATVTISKTSLSDSCKTANSFNPISVAKQRVTPNCIVSTKKDHAASDVTRDEAKHVVPKKSVTEPLKSSFTSTSKASHSSKISHSSVSQRTLLDSKDDMVYSSCKAYESLNVSVTTVNGESVGAVPAEIKTSTMLLPQRGEKLTLSSSLPSVKGNHSVSMHPPAPSKASATLSDEELALLLHQELNSSPRVPRVPRVRQAGGLPQLSSPAATSMLTKRSCSSGGKDNNSVCRRRNKDVSRDGPRSSHEIDDEAKKMDRIPPLPDQRKPDLLCTADASITRNMLADSLKAGHSVTKNIPAASTRAANTGPSSLMEANDQNLSSGRNSPRNISDDDDGDDDDDTGTTGALSHQTLPGLISEIMSKGKRMTYEELCNAVLPHWHSLRKHNGERYAYSSHSQAVLDCLRNRSEWAQLVDRGPKTNGNRKRHKLDDESTNIELEDNDGGKSRTSEGNNLDSHREEFPKGKRKARKRKRLALRGRGIKDVRRTQNPEMLMDDDIGHLFNSREESMFSEDEIQDGGTRQVGSDESASSDEAGTML